MPFLCGAGFLYPQILKLRVEVVFMNCVYILACADGTFYTGWTNDLKKRIEVHNAGKGAKYTRSRLPVKLVYSQMFDTKEDAMRREAQIKRLTRTEKIMLISAQKSDTHE